MPEIAEAQALLAELEASEPVAAELSRRETRSKLHAGYALATMMTKGFGAEETKAALARAASASGAARTPEYWTVIYGRINADMMSGDHRAARAGAEAFLAEAEAAGLPGHAAFARRMLGFLKFLAGDFAGARADLERALADYDERRDESFRMFFALDLRSNALAHLGFVAWHLGDFEEAERLTDEAIAAREGIGAAGVLCRGALQSPSDRRRLRPGGKCSGRRRGDARARRGARLEVLARDGVDLRRLGAGAHGGAARRSVPRRPRRLRRSRGQAARGGGLPLLAEVELAAGRRDEALTAIERGLTSRPRWVWA